jgi:hypothetical protein
MLLNEHPSKAALEIKISLLFLLILRKENEFFFC